ncbi:MAG TPA: hypothetical protein VFR47_25175 [Anaerolineales bacterium]|nr:hypothetical protein [Anaerolineales bacterium]
MKIQFATGLLIILLATCSIQEAAPADSGVEGQVFIGPMCPVVQEGQSCPDQPYQATLTVNLSNGQKITQVQTDQQGHFRIALKPGDYILHPESANVMPFAGQQVFRVEADRFTQLTVNYDSGVR